MKKNIIFSFIIMFILSIVLVFIIANINNIFKGINTIIYSEDINNMTSDYLYGEALGVKGNIKVRLKTNDSGVIKDIEVTDFSSKYYAVPSALQQLIEMTIDDYNANNVDTISGATDTSNTFKKAVNQAVGYIPPTREDNYDRVSLNDPEIVNIVTRRELPYGDQSLKTGFGAYIINNFSDADYNKNGNLATHEYLCGVLIDDNRKIIDVQFDHISSNIAFDYTGKVPTSNVRAYRFKSDKDELSFNGICTDGYYINITELETDIIKNKYLRNNKLKYEGKPGYNYFIRALESAMNNAVNVGAKVGDTMGLYCIKELNKNNIISPVEDKNGIVVFDTNYVVMTINNEQNISSCFLDKLENVVNITNEGKILGNRDQRSYTISELSNYRKYSKIIKNNAFAKQNLNNLSDLFTNNNIKTLIKVLSNEINDNGYPLENSPFSGFSTTNFLNYIELLSNCYIKARTILN